jgi:hypothetical protein
MEYTNYFNLIFSGMAHGVFMLNSNAMDIYYTEGQSLTWKITGGILDMFFFMVKKKKKFLQSTIFFFPIIKRDPTLKMWFNNIPNSLVKIFFFFFFQLEKDSPPCLPTGPWDFISVDGAIETSIK